MASSLDLHRIQESGLQLVNSNEDITTVQNNKIRLTYEMAIDKIYELSMDNTCKEYFYKWTQNNVEEKSFLVGAAVDKILGKIYVILRRYKSTFLSVNEFNLIENKWFWIDSIRDNGLEIDQANKVAFNSIESPCNRYSFKYSFLY